MERESVSGSESSNNTESLRLTLDSSINFASHEFVENVLDYNSSFMTEDEDQENHDVEADPLQISTTWSMKSRVDSIEKMGFFRRNCKPLNNGGLRANCVILICSAVGSGMVEIPYVS